MPNCPKCQTPFTKKSKVINPENHSVVGLLCLECRYFESFKQGEEVNKNDNSSKT